MLVLTYKIYKICQFVGLKKVTTIVCVFLRKAPTKNARLLQWLLFFRQFNAICPLFCSFVQHHQLELRTSKTYSKRQNLVQNKNIDVQILKNIGSCLWCFSLGFFSALCDVFEIFGFHQRVSPSFVSIFCNTMDVKRSQRVPPFTFFGTVTLLKNVIFNFFGTFKNLSRAPVRVNVRVVSQITSGP